MQEQPWYKNPLHLLASNRIHVFWPLKLQGAVERLNADTRIIIYAMCILYLINRDVRVVYLGLTVILVMATMHVVGGVKEGMRPAAYMDEGSIYSPNNDKCTQPTIDNPMGNVLLNEYTDNAKRPAACYYPTVKDKVKSLLKQNVPTDQADVYSSRNQSFRAFYSMPSTTIPNDQEAFARAAYGSVVDKTCRNDDGSCYPDTGSMFGQSRMPEGVHLRGTFGSGVASS